jgi:hypothetical protein
MSSVDTQVVVDCKHTFFVGILHPLSLGQCIPESTGGRVETPFYFQSFVQKCTLDTPLPAQTTAFRFSSSRFHKLEPMSRLASRELCADGFGSSSVWVHQMREHIFIYIQINMKSSKEIKAF